MLRLYSEFCGVGGDTWGVTRCRYVRNIMAANHWQLAIDSHEANFPEADHYCGDVRSTDIGRFPYAEFFWASPACPPWTDARGKRRDFDTQTVQQPSLFGDDPAPDKATKRARLLMEEVPRYLQAMVLRGQPVLVGVVENVVQCRLWAHWGRWVREIELMGYRTRLIAFNSMHATAPVSPRAPQSRDRLYLAYWHVSLGRDPDWDKWLRPRAWCEGCQEQVAAVQVWKKPGQDMGRYRSQYIYICPNRACGGQPVEPDVVPALAAIDPTIPGTPIKDRPENDPLKPATLARIRAGIRRYRLPLLTPAGGTWRRDAVPLDVPMPTRTTRETDGLAVPPLLVPVDARPGKVARPATDPARTQTARNETAVTELPLPFVTPLRGGGDRGRAYPVTSTLGTVSAQGNHHGLALPPLVMRNFTARGDAGQMTTPASEPLRTLNATGKQSLLTWTDQLLVPYYGSSNSARPAENPVGALTARDRYGLAQPGDLDVVDVDELLLDTRFRMLEPHEIATAMAFDPEYRVLAKSKRNKVRLYGNAVTPPVAEILACALVEAITGEGLEVGRG